MTYLYISVFSYWVPHPWLLSSGKSVEKLWRLDKIEKSVTWRNYKSPCPHCFLQGALGGSKGEWCNVSTTWSQSKLQKVLLSLLAGHSSWIFKVKKTCLSFGGKAATKKKTQIQQHTAFSYLSCLRSAGNLVFFSLFFKAVATCPGTQLVSLCGVFMFDVALCVFHT